MLDTALMALEEWAFSGLGTGRNADDVISELVKNNTCCAVLGIALEPGTILSSSLKGLVAAS